MKNTEIPKFVTLNCGVRMPRNGLGVYELERDTCFRAVKFALANGVRLIDTAHYYGNEREVGRAIRESGVPRDEIFVITKLYPNQFAAPEAAIAEAAEKLNVGAIDMLLLHHPGRNDAKAYRAMEKALAAGTLRTLGLSNWTDADLEKFLPKISVVPALVQNEIHPYNAEHADVAKILRRGIAVQGWYPLGGREERKKMLGDATICAIAAAHGVSAARVILRWHLQRGLIVIPGSGDPEHIAENTQLYDFALSDAEMAQIDALDRDENHDW